MSKRIFLSPPHMTGHEQKYIERAFATNWIAPLGENVDKFEEELATYNGVDHASALSSGTAGIHLALRLLQVEQNDTVFCSTLTFVASANPIIYVGAQPVFIDAEKDTWNMSPQALERAFIEAKKNNAMPKAVIVVHLYGQSAKMDELLDLCNHYGVPVIEDAAESLGTTYKGRKSGTDGAFGIYSFNGNKIITTSGGGALVSQDAEAIERSRYLATQARKPALHYEHDEIGYNYRMSNIVAGIGRGQLEVLDEFIERRRDIFATYKNALCELPGVAFQPELTETRGNRWLTTLTIDPKKAGVTRTETIEKLAEKNIESRPVWKPMHLQPLFKDAPFVPHDGNEDVARTLFELGICLPSGVCLSEDDQTVIIKTIRELFGK